MGTYRKKDCKRDRNVVKKNIEDVNILVIGDVMLDHYVYGEIHRISPEAPVPIVNVTKEEYLLGGAGNVVRNIRSLGANVSCVCSIGDDIAGTIVSDLFNDIGVDKRLKKRKDGITTQKNRIIAEYRATQMIRIDKEEIKNIDSSGISFDGEFDVIIISDYAKGMITADLMMRVKKLNIPIIVDPKPVNSYLYNDVFMMTPNEEEFNRMCLSSSHPFGKNIRYILKTMGKKGMELIGDDDNYFISSIPIDVYNVSGAGDTVVAVVSTCVAMGMDVRLAVRVANKCARHVVTKPDTSTVSNLLFSSMVVGLSNAGDKAM